MRNNNLKVDEYYEDKDGDHIPDRIDGTYSADGHITQSDVQTADELNKRPDPIAEEALAKYKDEQKKTESAENVSTQSEAKTVSYWRAVVTEDECSKLEKNNFPFDKSRKRTVEGKIPIRFKVELKQEFQKIISSSATIKVGGKIGG